MKLFRLTSFILVALLTWISVASTSARQPADLNTPNAIVNVQLLNVSDWHAQLDPSGTPLAGGAAVLAAYWQQDRINNPNSLTFTAGDAFGATPLLSNAFNEEPGVKAMRMMGIQVDTLGNHNFDRGLTHLQKMIDLAAAPTAPLSPGLPFNFVSANLSNLNGNLTNVAPYKIFTIGGVNIAVIGVTNPEAPNLVTPGNFGSIVITDPVVAANQARTAAAANGAQVFVAITHMGVTNVAGGVGTGPLINFANGLTGFDFVFGDHTDIEYSTTINGALVVENKSKGIKYSRVTFDFDTTTNTVSNKNLLFRTPLTTGVTPDTSIETMLQPYRQQLAAINDADIADATALFPRGGTPAVERVKEVALGNLITDAMRTRYSTQIAFTNGGGIRASLPSSYLPQNMNLRRPGGPANGYQPGPPFDVVVGDIYTILPFGNSVVVRNVTGGQLWRMLEHSVAMLPAADGRFGQISGFKFSYDVTRPTGSRVLAVALNNGTQIISNTTSTYSMATNDFTNAGGDGYTMLADGQGATREIMADVLRDYVQAQSTLTPTVGGRIVEVRNLQLLNVSDWHAQLDPSGTPPVGGAAVLSTYWKQDRINNPSSLTLTAGDAFGASPPLSGAFNEEPGVKAMRMMGIQVDTFGNHNFDRGLTHLQKMIDLAAAPTAPLSPGLPFNYVAANLSNLAGNLTNVAPYKIFTVGGVNVAVIGIVNPEAPTLVTPGNFGTLVITDPVVAANQARADAAANGAQVFVVLTHMGVTGVDGSGNATGPLVNFANGLTGFHVVLGDHTDVQYMKRINGALVLENKSKGITYARTNIQFDLTANQVITQTAQFVTPLASAVVPDSTIQDMLLPYRQQLAVLFDGVIGVATGIFPRGGTPAVERVKEVAIGNLITDAMRTRYSTQIAFTNGGGIRAALPSSYLPQNMNLRRPAPGYLPGPPYDLVVGDIFTVLPFGNSVVVRNVTGGQLWRMLEHSVAMLPAADGRFGQISGFKFTYDVTRPAGSRVISATLNNGTQIISNTTSTYSMATNDFTNAGGDGYTMLADGQGATREIMADVVKDYVIAQGTIAPTIEGRINGVPTMTDLPNRTIAEDTSTGPIAFTVADSETAAASLTVTARSSNTTLVPNANIVLGGSGANRTVTVTPAANESGSTTITITVSDGQATRTDTFVLTVTPVNDTPTISAIENQTIFEGRTLGPLSFTLGDIDTNVSNLSVTVSSSNPTLIPVGNIVIAGTGANRTVTITPAPNQTGSSNITITVSDGSDSATTTFVVTVVPALRVYLPLVTNHTAPAALNSWNPRAEPVAR